MAEIEVSTREAAERYARAAYREYVGEVIRVPYVMGYIMGDDSQEWHADKLIRVRVLETDDQSQTHWNDDHLDPYWDVELIDIPPNLPAGARGFWIDGPSFYVKG